MNEEKKVVYSPEDIKARLLEADCPSAIVESTCAKLQNLTPFAQAVFAAWYESGSLADDAFDIAGVTPKTLRAASPKINDVGVIVTCDHLARLVSKECAFLFGGDRQKTESEHKLSLQMMKSFHDNKEGA